MYSIQPDWTLSSDYYKKRVVNRLGIAHFYEFRINNLNAASLPSVPDDCVDVVFDLGGESAIAAGTVFERGVTWMVTGHTYFGMRFLPGVKPVILQGNFREYDHHQIDLGLCSIDRFIREKICELHDFNERCNFFMDYYQSMLARKSPDTTTVQDTVQAILSGISDRKGIVTIDEIVQKSGYSGRYIEKIFKNEMGLTPKKYANIMRFQGALDFIDRNPDVSICGVATDFGYYDQSAFVRAFKKCTGLAPSDYRKLIKSADYMSRIRNM